MEPTETETFDEFKRKRERETSIESQVPEASAKNSTNEDEDKIAVPAKKTRHDTALEERNRREGSEAPVRALAQKVETLKVEGSTLGEYSSEIKNNITEAQPMIISNDLDPVASKKRQISEPSIESDSDQTKIINNTPRKLSRTYSDDKKIHVEDTEKITPRKEKSQTDKEDSQDNEIAPEKSKDTLESNESEVNAACPEKPLFPATKTSQSGNIFPKLSIPSTTPIFGTTNSLARTSTSFGVTSQLATSPTSNSSFATITSPSSFKAFGSTSFTSSSSSPSTSTSKATPFLSFGVPDAKSEKSFSALLAISPTTATDEHQDKDKEGEIFGTSSKQLLSEKEVKTGEEDEDTLFTSRAKLYWMDEQLNWKERGVGYIKLNVKSNTMKSPRLVMRADVVFRLILNVSLFEGMPVQLEENFVRIVAIENNKPAKYAIKLNNADVSQELYMKILNCIKASQSSSKSLEKSITEESSKTTNTMTTTTEKDKQLQRDEELQPPQLHLQDKEQGQS
ncbi:8052_t:CDS:2 [Ambispora gerdemannii]|uniref:8052_t:CDS:1 n=1 Tax=Ambispora gerdemannii TaxID=144530 RepID=A0A9N8V8M9_9GLOM|nr:8052_t:CDS:2 [Ambispora gerdemannii]